MSRVIFRVFFCRLLKFSKQTFSKNSFGNTIRVSNSLNKDQARRYVRPDLGSNCLQRLSANDTRVIVLQTLFICALILASVSSIFSFNAEIK